MNPPANLLVFEEWEPDSLPVHALALGTGGYAVIVLGNDQWMRPILQVVGISARAASMVLITLKP